MIELAYCQAGDTTVSTPEYERVMTEIRALIAAEALRPGDRLPSIVRLAEICRASQTTVKTALLLLGREGVTRGQQGKATYVAGVVDSDEQEPTGS